MPAFTGKHYYTVDEKGRLIIPAPYRDILSSNYSPKLYLANDLFDRCIHIYPYEEWTKLEEKVRLLPKMLEEVRLFMRRVVASAQECVIDKQGRILIPASLREDAGISGDVAIVGEIDKIALWDRREWDSAIDLSKTDRRAIEERLAAHGL